VANLRRVSVNEAMAHALWEAHACIGQWAFCACLAMLRKAVDLWSGDYRDRNGMTFNKEAGERDDVFWRLRKIAEANPLYKDSIHLIIDGLRDEGNDALHDPVVCAGGRSGTYDGSAIENIRGPFVRLHALVVDLIKTTSRLTPLYSDERRWPDKPSR
jgi:hypothetical protein